MKSWLFRLPPLTSPTPPLAPVEQMSPASSRIPRLHTHGNTIWDHASAVRMCVWAVLGLCVCRNLFCVYLNVTVMYMYECILICVCCWMCVLYWLWRESEGVDCAMDRRWGAPGYECVLCYFLCCPMLCVWVCMRVCSCLFTYTPPGQEFPDELCLWQVGSFGKLDTHHTKQHILYLLACPPVPINLSSSCCFFCSVKIVLYWLLLKQSANTHFWHHNFSLGL